MSDVFIGSEAVLQGRLTPYQLRSRFRWIYPDVYLADYSLPSLRQRSEAAWLWSGRRGVVAGLAAAALHGSNWIDDDEHVELIWRNPHPPAGIIIRSQQLGDDEITRSPGFRRPRRLALPTTSVACRRAAGRWRLDALQRSSPFRSRMCCCCEALSGCSWPATAAGRVATCRRRGRVTERDWAAAPVDRRGLPTPTTQIPVHENWRLVGVLDMGWEKY